MKKTISLILVLVMMVTLFSGCHRPGEEAVTTNLSLDEQVRIAANNMQNSSRFASDGEYLYCSVWDDGMEPHNEIIKVNLSDFSIESTYETTMSYGDAFWPHNVVCVDDTLYYYNAMLNILFGLNTEMTECIELPFSEYYSFFQTDGKYYYVSDYSFFNEPGIFRVAVSDVNEDTKNDKSIFTKISDLYATNLYMQGDYLYFYSIEIIINGETTSEYGLWRVDLDGSNPIKITETRPAYFIVAEDKVYLVEEDECIYSMNLDGSDRKVLEEAHIDEAVCAPSINTAGGYIFYSHANGGTLHRVNTDGTNDIQLNDCDTTNIVIAGDWVIYQNEDDWKYYKMHFDGSNHSLINEVPTNEEPTDLEPTGTTEPSEMPTETEPAIQMQGWYTLEEAQEMTGLFILYPDGSFDRYYSGSVLTWIDSYMTYGTDYFPEDLVISINKAEYNKELLSKGQLVLFWPYENRVRQGLYAVEESGYSLFRTDDDGRLEGLILTRGSTTGTTLTQWNQNQVFYWSNSVNYTTINGVLKEKYDGFPSAEGREFASFPANQTYTIGVVEGTTLVEKEYETDHMYLLHADNGSAHTLTPTTNGYAVFDFSDTEPGEYVFTTSYWNEDSRSRKVVSTYIVIE